MKTLEQQTLDEFLSELRRLDIKLWVEGERLCYKAAKETLTSELLTQLRARKAEILGFLRSASLATNLGLSTISPVGREGDLPLSFAQERLWFQHQLEPQSPINNMPAAYRLKGKLNLELLHRIQSEIIQRHEILRTTFPAKNRQPTQVIAPELTLPIPIDDLQGIPAKQREEEAQRRAIEESRRPFELEHGSLLRLRLLRLAPDDHLLMITLHRIVSDGWSVDIFFREILALYEAYTLGKPSPLPELPIQYADYSHWQRQRLQGERLETLLNYWKQQLKGELPALNLPTDRPRPSIQTFNGSRRRLMFPKTLNDALNALSQQEGATLFMTLLAAYKVLLYRYSGQEDVMVCFSNAGRQRMEIEHLIGPFFNTLVLRTSLESNPTFRELIRRVKDVALGAFANQELPFDKLVAELGTDRNRGRSSLFQVLFALNPPWTAGNTLASVELPGLTIDSLFGYLYTGQTKFDLTLVMRETDEGLRVLFEYNTDLFDGSTILRMMDYFRTLLESIVANPDERISKLQLLTKEQHQLLVEWNRSEVGYPAMTCIHQLVEAQVEETPDAIAVIAGDRQLTYRELNQRANQLAHYLRSQGVESETLVSLCMGPSLDALVGILGILKAGGAYIPLDPTYLHERRAYKLQDAKPRLILTQAHLVESLPPHQSQVVRLDTDWDRIAQHSPENPPWIATAQNLAYVIYTSGSTGKPKGVCITHQSMVNHSMAIAQAFELTEGDRVLQFSSMSFDVQIEELFPTWIQGASVVLCSEDMHTSATQFLQFIARQRITVLNLPTAFWHELVSSLSTLQRSLPTDVRLVVAGGEKVLRSAYQTWLGLVGQYPRWLNAYGPTEATVTTTLFDPSTVAEGVDTLPSISIGRPIANTQTYILDRELQPVPIGVPGELYIGGAGIARCYLNQPELTQERFLPNPFSDKPDTHLYKTGDLARYRPDGNIEFLGRLDNQVKLCGFRIELEEVEAALAEHPSVQQAVVLIQEDIPDEKCLVAYLVVHSNQHLQSDEIGAFLSQKLPPYMIPSAFFFLEALPITSNNKIDRRALLALKSSNQDLKVNYVAFRDEVEQRVTEIWERVLGMQPIGVSDNFFALGGHSILAVQLFTQIEETFGKNLPLATLLQAPTIEQLANVLRQQNSEISWSPLVTIQTGSQQRPPLFCIHGGGFNVLVYRDLALNLDPDQPVYGLQAQGLEGNGHPLRDRLEEIAADYIREIRTVQPHGPYYLGGLSNGGNIALEMAQQLHDRGEQVALLAMFDSYAPNGIKLLPPLPRLLSSLHYVWRYSLPSWMAKHLQSRPGVVLADLQQILKALAWANHPSENGIATSSEIQKAKPTPLPWLQTSSLEQHMNRLSQYILEHSPWSFFTPSAQLQGMDNAVSITFKKLEESYSKVHRAYSPQPYPGKITLLRAEECPPGYYRDPQLGWGKIAKAGVEVYTIPGHHTSIMESKSLAEKLAACIETAIRENNNG